METLLWKALGLIRPRVGWPRALLGALAVLCLPMAAEGSNLRLPSGLFFSSGMCGYALGLWWAPPPACGPRRRATLALLLGAAALLGAVVLALAADAALPPAPLVAQDVWAWVVWLGSGRAGTAPHGYSAAFLAEALPRFWEDLLRAPANGVAGARLLVALCGALLGWLGAITLGLAVAGEQRLLGCSLPLLAALLLVTMFGGTSPFGLASGLALVLVLAVDSELRRRESGWERGGADFSTELRLDVLGWGSALVATVLLAGWLLPAWLNNPVAAAIWPAVEPPSGLAVLERQAGAGASPLAPARVTVSHLPALELGRSIEQGPPEQIALRVRLEGQLPASEWPHYWRARLLDQYNGRSWSAKARVVSQPALRFDPAGLAGVVVQTIEDTHADRSTLAALPDVIGVDVPLNAELLADGTLAALTRPRPLSSYRVLSRPQEYAEPPRYDQPPPDMSAYLALPPDLPPRVGELARALAGRAGTPYQQALAIEVHLRGLPYSYEVAPLPRAGDAVDQFLFDMRRGYCTYYASAMAIMARSLQIPARVAVGYATGSYDEATGTYTVRENDAHAWPELFIDGRWLPFEPTPVRPLPARSGEQRPAPPPPVTPLPEPVVAPGGGPLIWIVVAVAVLVATALGVWLQRRRLSQSATGQAALIQQQLELLGRRAGVAWPAGATLHEYGALLAAALEGAGEALATLTDLLERARYGHRPLSSDEERRLDAAWRQVAASARHR